MSDGRGRIYALSGGAWSQTFGFTGLTDIAYNGRDGWAVAQGISGTARVLYAADLLSPQSASNSFTIAVDEAGGQRYVAVDFGSPDVGFALRIDGEVRRTADGGQTWAPASAFPAGLPGDTREMTDLFVLDENVAFVTTDNGSTGWTTSGGGFPTYATPVNPVNGEASPEAAPAAVPVVALGAPAPNPLRTTARIQYRLEAAGRVRLGVVDALGREVAVLAEGPRAAGEHEAVLDASGLAAGVYVVRLVGEGAVAARTVTVVR
ncbi:MAG: T9SS type A sorting domain-containing protein [Bacteroidota bacterium]